jgi:hypothetical protein
MENQHVVLHAEHAAMLGISLATFRRHIPDLLARGYPARRIGQHLVADREAVLAWLRQGDGSDTRERGEPEPPRTHATEPVKRGPGRPRKHPRRAGEEV